MRLWVIKRAARRFARDVGGEAARNRCAFSGVIFGATSGVLLSTAVFAFGVRPLIQREYAAQYKAKIDQYCRVECDPLAESAYLKGVIDSHEGKAQIVERWAHKEYSIVKPGGIVEQVDDSGNPLTDDSVWRREWVGPPTPVERTPSRELLRQN